MDSILQAAPMALQVIGQAGSAVAGSQASSANAKADRAEAKQAIINASIEEQQSRRRSRQILAKQEAKGAAAGVDVSSGSPLEVMLDSARQAEEEALLLRMGGKIRSNSALMRAQLESQKGTSSILGGIAGIGGTLAANKSILGDLWSKASGFFGGTPEVQTTNPITANYT